MKTIVIYSTLSGNTKKVAEAITKGLPAGTPCLPMAQVKKEDLASYDCVFAGFWVDRGNASQEAREVLKDMHNAHIALFATLGADPDSDHAAKTMKNAAENLPDGVMPYATFLCQGAVDPKVIERMNKKFPAGHPHGKSPERDALLKRASTHPDEKDLANATAFAEELLQEIALEQE